MRVRFRRSFRVIPGVKINLNKKSVGVTVGRRGMHYTVNSKGQKTASVGLPGTGLSVQQTFKPKQNPSSCQLQKLVSLRSGLIGLAVVFIVVVLVVAAH